MKLANIFTVASEAFVFVLGIAALIVGGVFLRAILGT